MVEPAKRIKGLREAAMHNLFSISVGANKKGGPVGPP